MNDVPSVYNPVEVALMLKVPEATVKVWHKRGELRPVALSGDGRPLFLLTDVYEIGRRLAAQENVRVLRANFVNVTQVRRGSRPGQPPKLVS